MHSLVTIKMPDLDAISPTGMKLLLKIHRDFDHNRDMMLKIVRNENDVIYRGLCTGHEKYICLLLESYLHEFGIYIRVEFILL